MDDTPMTPKGESARPARATGPSISHRPAGSRRPPVQGIRAQSTLARIIFGSLAIFALLAGMAVMAPPILAQNAPGDGPGGVRYTFGLSNRLQFNDNRGLDPDGEASSLRATTGLSFGVLSETRVSSFSAGISGGLRASKRGGGGDIGFDLSDPSATLSYSRRARDARLTVEARVRRSDAAFLDELEFFDDLDGDGVITDDEIILVEDEDADGGTRLTYGLTTTLRLRQTAPVGVILSAGYSGTQYSDIGTAELYDSTRIRASAGLSFTFSPVTQGSLTLSRSRYREDDPENTDRTTNRLLGRISHTRPNGTINSTLSVTESANGDLRTVLSFGRNFTLPRGQFSTDFGVTRGDDGDLFATGALSLTRSFPLGQIRGQLRRSIVDDDDDEQREITVASVSYDRQLSRISSLNLDLAYIDNNRTGSGDGDSGDTQSASFGATYQHRLTEDWGLDVGYRHRRRVDKDDETATDNSVFLSLNRDWVWRR